MIKIQSPRGGYMYEVDESTGKVYKDGKYLPKAQAEPAYCGNSDDSIPSFIGIYFGDRGEILTKSGNLKKVVDINSIK
jgi:hypothetical protein